MSATRPDLQVVRDPGPQGAWLRVLEDVQEALNEPPSFTVHDLAAKLIIGLAGMLLGCLWTLFALVALGAL